LTRKTGRRYEIRRNIQKRGRVGCCTGENGEFKRMGEE